MNNKFNPQGFSLEIFKKRYAFTEQETWEEACGRVARQMSVAETPEKQKIYHDKFQEILTSNLFVPGGRIWYNSGRTVPQLLNCFVLDNNKDSREGWAKSAYNMILTSMTGGGCGDDFSDVRPRGTPISSQKGEAPGAIELMRLIDACAKPVKAGGQRRVALMFSLDLDHPDVEEFLNAKLVKGELTHANVSVRSRRTKDFIKAVKNDDDWELSWKGKHKRVVKAAALWKTIVNNAYNSAEPGFLNWELVESESNISYIEPLITTNPCIAEGQLVSTDRGWIPIEQVTTSDKVITQNGFKQVTGTFYKGIKDIVHVQTVQGYSVRSTPDHRFLTTTGWKQADQLTPGEKLVLQSPKEIGYFSSKDSKDRKKYRRLGQIYGDGFVSADLTHAGITFGLDREAADAFAKESALPVITSSKHRSGNAQFVINTSRRDFVKSAFFAKKEALESLRTSTLDQIMGFIEGWWLADGHIEKANGMVALAWTSADKAAAEQLQRLLIALGVRSSLYFVKRTGHKTDAKYGFKSGHHSYRISVSSNGRDRLAELSPLFKKELAGLVKEFYNTQHTAKVLNVTRETAPQKVYDLSVDGDHSFSVNGVIVHNCGEIALSAYDCCCLGHLVLPRLITSEGIDWPLLGNTIRTAVRFLDNVLTVNQYPLPEMKAKSHNLRRIGLGTTGLADTLALLGYRYGSPEGNQFIDKLFRFISKAAYEASIMLAVEKGPFPLCNPEKHIESGFIKRMPEKTRSLILEHGIRNCAILTQAPTGTVSILSDNCSSGIEPMFSPAYERRFWDKDTRKVELVFHPLFEKFMAEGRDVSHFVGSRDISVQDHMEVQKIVQKHIDNAVSKTINIPEDYPIEEVDRLWLQYLPHLKGTTFYRENTRGFVREDGVVEEPPLKALSLDDAKNRFLEKHAIQSMAVDDCPKGVCEI